MHEPGLTLRPCAIDSQPTRPNPTTHYILVRPDLPRGLLAAQIVHAAGESSPGNLAPGTYAVVLAATPDQMRELKNRLDASFVGNRLIVEKDGRYKGEIMALGISPAPKETVRRWVSSFPLLE